jgi:hypothetical protein
LPTVQRISELRSKSVRAKLAPVARITDFGCDAGGLKRHWNDREWSEANLDGIRNTTAP